MHGGKRDGAGRKSKAEEQLLAEKLSPYEDKAHAALQAAVKRGERWAVKLYFEYAYGKPVQRSNMTIDVSRLSDDEVDKVIGSVLKNLDQ